MSSGTHASSGGGRKRVGEGGPSAEERPGGGVPAVR